mmetsp:Transcript_42809/g.87496  ORF Transcript_42809/g.87496 Transcript_42809/m.87496 type:complete len:165 (+) Transcript_42809:75-569(+)|eukprot:CAMPEP_0181321530 /NCGR_PEP_ID=MMETSP1101-20121128/18741_1 /TAXON_ID=46948 /ORGANISM="Rhodomonas abbreviata, Strain Caron Lab Isolate" /LENGTH=164 /DNA_ID=CAMNT_0023429377 /DNA_START=63 /DNA_END=557 /DNA_ORIENTATION=+
MNFEDIPPSEEEEVVVLPPAVPEESAPAAAVPVVEDEPAAVDDTLAKFNAEWEAKLAEKREAEFEMQKAARANAEEERAAWNTQRDIRLKAKKDSNRSEEQVLQEALESEVENSKTWERVSKLIDAGESADGKGSDTSRMRKLFIQLKSEPLDVTRAAAAAKGE